MSTVVHHASMYANQAQDDEEPSVLGTQVTKVTGGPATFNGVAPSNKAELDQYSIAADFDPASVTAWGTAQWVDLGRGRYYTWDGNSWETIALATGVSSSTSINVERLFTGGRAPKKVSELEADDFGQSTAWAYSGQYVTLGGTGSGGAHYYWDGDSWAAGEVPGILPGPARTVAGTEGDEEVDLTWLAPNAPAGNSPVVDYVIRAYDDAEERLDRQEVGSGALLYTFTGLTNDADYTFTVAAVNDTGEGPESTPSAVLTPTAP
jgi:hypothetical protein